MSVSWADNIPTLNVLNLIAYAANVGLVSGVPKLFNLPDNAQVSDKYQTIVTPAGWAFAIWGLIFIAQAVWSVAQLAIPNVRTNPLVVSGVAHHYIAMCAVQVAWTFAFGLEQIVMSMIWMSAILFFLIRIYMSQDKVLTEEDNFESNYWLLRFPFNVNLGWIVAATLVNFNVVLVAHSASSFIQLTFAILSVVIALVVAAFILYLQKDKKYPDVVIPMVLVWALSAISQELSSPKDIISNTFSLQEIDTVKNASFVSAALIFAASVGLVALAFWKNRKTGRAEEANLL